MDRMVFGNLINNMTLYGTPGMPNDIGERLRFQQTVLQNLAFWQNYNHYTSAIMAAQNFLPPSPLSLLTTTTPPQILISSNSSSIHKNRVRSISGTPKDDLEETPRNKNYREMIKCNSCDKCFKTRKEHRQHIILHHERRFECERCTKTFLTQGLLDGHINKKHSPDDGKKIKNVNEKYCKQFQCKICDRSYETYYNYKEHLAKHDGKIFKCSVCNKLLSGQSALSRHTKIHSKPHECIICKDRFSSAYDLDCHFSYYHSSIKRFRCQFCNRALYNYSGKLRHERLCLGTNTNDKNIKEGEEKENND
uniref:C2H2-type domain-containing protein n=1 Tax=Strongyloides papillosus TaxID=174720 RepID=A0A0N5CBJ8_STREA